MITKRLFVLLTLLAFVAFEIPAQSSLSGAEKTLVKNVSLKEIRRVTTKLSEDKFEGRGSLQPGGDASAKWIADQMKKVGLKPLGDSGSYLQAVPLVETVFVEGTSVKIGGQELKNAAEWAPATLFGDDSIKAPLVFVGYASKADGRDDIKGYDLKGKIAVLIEGAPSDVPTPKWQADSGLSRGVGNAIAAGASGIIVVANGREILPRPVMLDFASRRKITTVEGARELVGFPALLVSDSAAEKMFAGSGVSFREALGRADRKDFSPLELKQEADFTFNSKATPGVSHNVVGYFEGSDPILKREAVVFTAHYDAFGLMNGKIYNGAADNAIGNGEMFAAAKAFAKMKVKPRRSLIFISVGAEEHGLLGSKYYANNPTWDITKIAANLNLDGIGTEIMGPIKRMVGFGADYSTLGPLFQDMTRLYGIEVMDDPIPEQGVFARSDHYSFVTRGVPALMLLGTNADTKEQFAKSFYEFETTKYHQPSDDIYRNWYWSGAKTVSDIMTIIGYRVAQQDATPSFTAGNPYSNLKRGDRLPE